ncbi:MAG: sigma-70 family RNA polymerase sigma factor [Actinomycetota bacterium]
MPRRPATDRSTDWFDELYREHRDPLVRHAIHRGAVDPEGVADLALFDTYRAIDRLRSHEPPVIRAYLFRAARSHVARERARHRDLPIETTEEMADARHVEHVPGFEDTLAGAIDLELLVAELPPDQQEVLRLRFVEDLSAEEVGRRLGKSGVAVRQLQLRAVRRLRRAAFALAVLIVALGALFLALSQAESRRADTTPVDRDPAPRVLDDDAPASTTTTSTAAADRSATTAQALASSVSIPEPTTTTTAPPDLRIFAYDGFGAVSSDTPADGGPSTTGSGPEVVWEVSNGAATLAPTGGLGYTDPVGNELRTTPGALQVVDIEGEIRVRRTIAPPPEPDGTYWVSYLLRLDTEAYGDAFWTPDGSFDRAGAGIQGIQHLRFVNGPHTDLAVEPTRTWLVVVEVRADGASLWIDPTLGTPSPPTAVLDTAPSPLGDALIFRFNDQGDGRYTIDEARIGASFEAVTPIG